jgi:hypothetical protein
MRKNKLENAGPRAIKDLLGPMRDAVEAKAPSGRGIVLRNKVNGSGNVANESHSSTTPRQLQLIASADLIFSRPADLADTAYLAREMVQASLPHKDPGNVPGWVRRNGNSSLYIQPGFNPETGKNYGFPYGTIPRLLLFWITTEAVRTQSRRIELGASLNEFMRNIGLNPNTGGGKRGDSARVIDQMKRLFEARFAAKGFAYENGSTGEGTKHVHIADDTVFWWDRSEPSQQGLWNSFIVLSEPFYNSITASPVPLDMRALRGLKRSPLALDLYALLTYEAYRAAQTGRPRYETWSQLHAHLGGDYKSMTKFSQNVKAALLKIKLLYPGLRLGTRRGGLEVLPESATAIAPAEPFGGHNIRFPAKTKT